MAVANSDFDKAAGRTKNAAAKYANHTDGPVLAAASPGNAKMPIPIIALTLKETTATNPKRRSNVFNGYLFPLEALLSKAGT